MANTTTFLSLRTQALDRADMTGDTFIDTDRLKEYVNLAIRELYDLIIKTDPDFFQTKTTTAFVDGTEEYSLPSDFYKLLKVFYLDGNERTDMRRFDLRDLSRDRLPYLPTTIRGRRYRYREQGSNIMVHPKPGTGSMEIWYVPQPADLSDDSDTVEAHLPIGWEEFVIYRTAEKCAAREEDYEKAQYLSAKAMEVAERILDLGSDRDQGESDRVTDAYHRWGIDGGYNR